MQTSTATLHLHAADEPELVHTPAVHYVSVLGSGAPGTDQFYRKKLLIADIARDLTAGDEPVIEIHYWYPENSMPVEIADFYSVNPIPSLQYRVMAVIPDDTTPGGLAVARARVASASDAPDDAVELFRIPGQDVVQVMHHGRFADEFPTLGRLGRFAAGHRLHRNGPHHELHLDPFAVDTPQDTLRTILRDPIA